MPIQPEGPFSIIEDESYRLAVESLCTEYGLSWPRVDAITNGVTWALARDPLSWDEIGDDVYAVQIRGGGVHPDLVVVATVDVAKGAATLVWIGC